MATTNTAKPPRERRPSTSAPISDLQGPVGPANFTRPKHKRTVTGFGPGEIKTVEASIPEPQREAWRKHVSGIASPHAIVPLLILCRCPSTLVLPTTSSERLSVISRRPLRVPSTTAMKPPLMPELRSPSATAWSSTGIRHSRHRPLATRNVYTVGASLNRREHG
jgi:hypothetical protein